MATLPIVQYPDACLREKVAKVTVFDQKLKRVVDQMFETHYAQENCAALAANQLGIMQHITVIDFSESKDQPLCLINGKILARGGEDYSMEGCMSVGPYNNRIGAKVKRAAWVKVTAQDITGKAFTMKAEGFLAKCIQHELDHLDGGAIY